MLNKKCLLVCMLSWFNLSMAIAAPPAVHPTTEEPLVITCYRGTPTAIDGDLSDWNLEAMTPAVLSTVEQVHSGQASWTGPADCSAEFYVMWDDEKIYMAVIVKDDILSMNKTDGDIWNADCIEVFFATTNAVEGHDEHYQYGFNANNQTWNWCNMDNGQTDPDYLEVASTLTDDGYIIEASIEHGQMLSLDFSEGNAIGFHPVVDDADNEDRKLQMTWTGREAHDQSLGYGHLILSPDSPEPAIVQVPPPSIVSVAPEGSTELGPVVLHADYQADATFQWYFEGEELPGETGEHLFIDDATVEDHEGTYTVVVDHPDIEPLEFDIVLRVAEVGAPAAGVAGLLAAGGLIALAGLARVRRRQ